MKARILLGLFWAIVHGTAAGQIVEPLPPTLEHEYFGIHFHDPHERRNWPNIGMGSWRLWDARVSWPHLEPQKGNWTFKQLDSYVSDSKAQGMSVLLPLGLSPTWAASRPEEDSAYKKPGWASPPRDLSDWSNYVEKVMRRYRGRIEAYEIWNEPNLTRFYSGTAAQLVEMTCIAKRIRDEVDPTALIVSPAATEKEKGVQWLREFLTLGGGSCIDVIGFHFYLHAHEPPEYLVKYVRMVKEAVAAAGLEGLPVWNTESGWYFELQHSRPKVRYHIVPYEETAGYVMRAMTLGASEGLKRFYWYAWNNGMMGGLVETDTKELALGAKGYRALMSWIDGRHVSKCKSDKDVWQCEVRSEAGTYGWIMWTTRKTGWYAPSPADGTIDSLDSFGDISTKKVRAGESVNVTHTPLLIRLSE
jgi:hypothetical protein